MRSASSAAMRATARSTGLRFADPSYLGLLQALLSE